MARGGHFNPDVNPRLLKLIEGMKYDKYGVRPTSGYRPGDARQHGRGQAIDIELLDPQTQAALANYQDPSTFGAYQEYANALYQYAQQNDPELANQLRWGGYFSGGKGKYGALDLMHFDTAGDIGMAGGSWAGGLNEDQAKLWGLQAGGGLGQGPSGGAPDNPQTAFFQQLWPYALQASQVTGVDPRLILAQAAQETGYGKSVPGNNYFGIKGSGANTGAPQNTLEFVNGKMTPTRANFRTYESPEESFQDYAQFLLNNKRYAGYRSGKGLEEQAKALGESGYATDPDYGSSVLKIAQGIPEGGFGAATPNVPLGGSTTQTAGGAAPVAPKAPVNKWKEFGKDMLAGMGGGSISTPSSGISELPKAVIAQNEPTTIGGGSQEAEMKRQSLAQIMARLNSGKLF